MATFAQNGIDDGVSDSLIVCLDSLQKNCSHEQYMTALSTLLKLCRNALDNPTEEKYRSVKIENKSFAEKVWKFPEAQQFLIAAGWSEVDGLVILYEDKYLQSAVRVLEANTPAPIQSTTRNRTQSHLEACTEDDQVKQQVLDNKKKKYKKEYQSMLQEKKRIADQIKADRRETSTRVTKDARARDLKFGSNMKRFEDIGVNLNHEGG
ncbi:hypothetical protein CHS0354_037836 [Potamilus streckersoni]|uniref:PUB domain-containing protein n=1 Tax=Potamilus streckersoni TaxID=2493646 RepID=A0AAE0SIR9_9BIVA|nr:hypothetical protein CHS0354_037836 [Potamilus streckersoni]